MQALTQLLQTNPQLAQEKSSHQWTGLWVAARCGQVECVRALLPHSDVGARESQHHCSALDVAAQRGHASVVELLLEHANPNEEAGEGRTPLTLAINAGHTQCVRVLLTKANASQPGLGGHTPLVLAVNRGDLDCIRLLLPHCDVNHRDAEGDTALMAAVRRGRLDCVRALVPHSQLDVQTTDKRFNGFNALMLAIQFFDPLDAKRQSIADLLADTSDPLQCNKNGETALEMAIDQERWGIVDRLCQRLPLVESLALLQDAPLSSVPRHRARLEQEELQQVLSPGFPIPPRSSLLPSRPSSRLGHWHAAIIERIQMEESLSPASHTPLTGDSADAASPNPGAQPKRKTSRL